ncbi:MAG: acyltransferase [Rhodocyclaceae bacterium]|nr:acyltransferase [Rhodocyclaceae bacterium]
MSTEEELRHRGIGYVGRGVRLSRLASLHNPSRIRIGDYSRIDDFCVLSAGEGGISIGRNVHVAVYTSLIGAGPITVEDFANLSSRVAIYSSNDDYSGATMTNPTVPAEFKSVTNGPVRVGRHVIVGSGSVVLPNVTLHEGAVIGALSLANRDCDSFWIYAGVPARRLKERSRKLLQEEVRMLSKFDAQA